MLVNELHVVFLVWHVLTDWCANDCLDRHVDGLGIAHEIRGRAIASVVNDSDQQWLVLDGTLSLPHSKTNRSSTETLFRTELVAIGAIRVLRALITLEDNALRIVNVRINRDIHELFTDDYV